LHEKFRQFGADSQTKFEKLRFIK